METSIFDYDLPEDRIAQVPLPRRESSRMLLLKGQLIEDRRFEDFPDLLKADDCVVFNDSRVFPARLRDGTTEILFLRHIGEHTLWEALCKPARRFRPGTTAHLKGLEFKVEPPSGHYGKRMLRLLNKADLLSELSRVGEPPLPPYIHRHGDPALRSMDVERYQTIFAKNPGSAAAPTAGLHFPQEMIRRIEEKCMTAWITLHVSNATFQPIRCMNIEDHRMDPEAYVVSEEAAAAINSANRLIAVGTTVVRAIESAASNDGLIRPGASATSAYITPGYQFRAVDCLLTNFHQPRSSLLVLVSAFAGAEEIRGAYRHALDQSYRFLSYGDCMFISPS